jgi:hypothetical protein
MTACSLFARLSRLVLSFPDLLLVNHVALQTEVFGANQHESHWIFDICYNNTSDVTTITGGIHSINKANFAILCWFGMNIAPRFTDMQAVETPLLRLRSRGILKLHDLADRQIDRKVIAS